MLVPKAEVISAATSATTDRCPTPVFARGSMAQ
jgi:hypothetical protein